MPEESHAQIVEALLFSSQHALSTRQIADIIGIKEARKVRPIIDELNEFYKENQRAFAIRKVAGGFLLRTDSKFKQWIKKGKTLRPINLSPAVMETLAMVAYQQPVTRAEIEGIRTVDSTYALRSLLDKKLIKIVGKKEVPGKPLLYGTRKTFLELFGFNTINELPRIEDFDIISEQEQITPSHSS
ncbi:MAG: SMC-Scp complex subunit ScpB [Proteobacteria bacterium]|nr:SMC-Scp complex subunit ScpB [Pseudomonadota bacterium]